MNLHALSRRQRLAVAATAVTAVAAAVALPVQDVAAAGPPTASATVADDTLVITGTQGPDDIQIVPDGPDSLLVDLGRQATPLRIERTTFTSIAVFLGGGNDRFTASARGVVIEPLLVVGGNGDDTITGGAGNDTLVGGNGDDTVDGGRGADTEILGLGDDTAAWDPGEGNDVVEGGLGHDTLVFNGSNGNEKFDLSANGSRALLTRDAGNIRMDLRGVEALHLATLGGVDQVTVHDLRGTDLNEAAVDLSTGGTGDGQPDSIVLEGSDGPDQVLVSADGAAVDVAGLSVATRITGSEGFDQLHIDTGAGNDSVVVGDAVAKLITVAVA